MGKRVKRQKRSASPGHKLGQLIGNFFEKFVDTVLADRLAEMAREHRFYLDRRGQRDVRGERKKLTWEDTLGNKHDLDFVLEQGGSTEKIGRPIAFVEAAWRRYTKHSRNKVGEIEAALIHLRDSHRTCRFVGAIVAGEWTKGAVKQWESHGITVLHIPFAFVAAAFRLKDIDLSYAEKAKAQEKRLVADALEALGEADRAEIAAALEVAAEEPLKKFLLSLEASITTEITQILMGGTFGKRASVHTIAEATAWLDRFDPSHVEGVSFENFEVLLRFKDGREINGRSFPDKAAVLFFLQQFASD